jgi:hypothetical protein
LVEHVRNKEARFLLTARKSYEMSLTRKQEDALKKCKIREIKKEDFSLVADSIINNYSNSENIEGNYNILTLENRDKIKNLADGNYLILAYLLKAWKPGKGINMALVYNQIKKDIDDLEKEFRVKYDLTGVLEVLITLAPFSMIEIPISKWIFDEEFGKIKISSKVLSKLVEYGEIQLIENLFYRIPHSKLAELYLKAYIIGEDREKTAILLYRVTEFLREKGYSGHLDQIVPEMLCLYIKANPKIIQKIINPIVIHELRALIQVYPEKRIASILEGDNFDRSFTLFKLFQKKEIFDALIYYINKEKNIGKIGWTLYVIGLSTGRYKLQEILKKIDHDPLVSKIEMASKKNFKDVKKCLCGICRNEDVIVGRSVKSIFNKIKRETVNKALTCHIDIRPINDAPFMLYFFKERIGFEKDTAEKFWNAMLNKTKIERNLNDFSGDLSYIKTLEKLERLKIFKKVKKQLIIQSNLLLYLFEKSNLANIDIFFTLHKDIVGEIIISDNSFAKKILPILSAKIKDAEIKDGDKLGNYVVHATLRIIVELSLLGENGITVAKGIINEFKHSQLLKSKIEDSKNRGVQYWMPYEENEVKFTVENLEIPEFITTQP